MIAAMKGKWEKSKAAYYCQYEGKAIITKIKC